MSTDKWATSKEVFYLSSIFKDGAEIEVGIHLERNFFLNGCLLEEVPTFKYLGIIISSDLSWSQHMEGIKARKIIGMLYKRYYQ